MRASYPIVLAALVAAAFGLSGAKGSSGEVASPKPVPVAKSKLGAIADAGAPVSDDVAASLLRRYLLKEDPLLGGTEPLHRKVEFLVATFPDPVDSGFDHLFDRYVSSLTSALQRAGYFIDLFSDSPWPRGEGDDAPDESVPGVILFRGAKGQLLVVYLVGEHPTAGVHRAQLLAALDSIEAIADRFAVGVAPAPLNVADAHQTEIDGGTSLQVKATPSKAGESPKVRVPLRIGVLGPSFSGSATSLSEVLSVWARTARHLPQLQLITGTATALSNVDVFSRTAKGFASLGGELTFSATILPDDVLLQGLYEYIRTRERPIRGSVNGKVDEADRTTVVFLRESSTSYAAAVGEQDAPLAPSQVAAEPCQDFLRCRSVSFPLHISELRSAYGKSGRFKPREDFPHRLLEVSFDHETQPRDVYPPTSQATQFTLDVQLANTLSALARENPRYVVIVATDPRDSVFLVRELRETLPEVRIVLLESDLLFTHDDLQPYLRGALVASSYPLTLSNQLRTFSTADLASDAVRQQFPSGEAEGVFNAALMLVGRADAALDYGMPLQCPEDSERCRELKLPVAAAESRPPMWLLTPARAGFLPLVAIDPLKDLAMLSVAKAYSAYVAPKAAGIRPAVEAAAFETHAEPGSMLALLAAVLGGTVLIALSYIAINMRGEAGASRMSEYLSSLRLTPTHARFAQENRFWLFLSFSVLGLLGAFVGFVFFIRAYVREPLMAGFIRLDGSLFWFQVAVRLLTVVAGIVVVAVLLEVALQLYLSRKPASGFEQGLQRALIRFHDFVARRNPVVLIGVVALGLLAAMWWVPLRYVLGASARAVYSAAMGSLSVQPSTESLWLSTNALDLIFFYERTSAILGGASIVPVALLSAVGSFSMCVLILRSLRVRYRFERHRLLDAASLRAVLRGSDEQVFLSRFHKLPLSPASLIIFAALFGCTAVMVGKRLLFGFEGKGVTWIAFALLCFIYLLTLAAYSRAHTGWLDLSRLLKRLTLHPLAPAFQRLPKNLLDVDDEGCDEWRLHTQAALRRLGLDATGLELEEDDGAEFYRREVAPEGDYDSKPVKPKAASEKGETDDEGSPIEAGAATAAELAAARATVRRSLWSLVLELEDKWRAAKGEPLTGDDQKQEDLVALQVVHYLRQQRDQIHNSLVAATFGLVVLLMLSICYPFQYQKTLSFFVWFGVFGMLSATLFILVRISRDTVLSWLTGTDPGQVSFDRTFLGGVLVHLGVPLFSLLATQLPGLSRPIAGLIEPMTKLLGQ